MLFVLLAGCCANRITCPDFPVPNEHVQGILDELSDTDREVWAWGNQLLDLCQQLGTCEPDE